MGAGPQAYQQGFKGNCWCYEACSVKHRPGLALLRAALTFTLENLTKLAPLQKLLGLSYPGSMDQGPPYSVDDCSDGLSVSVPAFPPLQELRDHRRHPSQSKAAL